jgi:hypoxanthine phosphoribosyltransferase
LISETELNGIVTRLGERITRDYENAERTPLLVCILKGSVVFYADLIRKIDRPVDVDFMKVSSYCSGTTGAAIELHLDLAHRDYTGLDILIVEDIIDSGRTLAMLTELLKSRGARSVKICTLLNKPSRRAVNVDVVYCGADIPDEFVVGYGLDFDERYRNLPYVGILKPEIYTK